MNSTHTSSILQKLRLSQAIKEQRLPINEYKDDIVQHIKDKRVTCIHGETGCGKSTMVPLFITEMFYDMRPKLNIVVSQPRRLAAKNLAKRVSSLLGEKEGQTVGYKISREVKVSSSTKITYLTTGYLLQILVNNPEKFSNFTHIVLDEIHERQTDNDLLSLVVKLCMKKYNVGTKIIVMSATLQGELFSRYFSQADRSLRWSPPSPIFVGVKTHKIEECYIEDLCSSRCCNFTVDEQRVIMKAVFNYNHDNPCPAPVVREDLLKIGARLIQEKSCKGESTLVFLPGIFEIQDMYDKLEPLERKSQTDQCDKKYRIFVLHSQVPRDEQMAVFKEPPRDTVHVLLATNIAESSLTLPKVRIVIDYGIRKQLLYDSKCKMTVLKNSWISQASACQRKGRTGRVFEGIVYRMFTRQFFNRKLEEFDPPEIETSPLDKLVLKVKHMMTNIAPEKTVSSILAEAVQPPDVNQLPEAIDRLADIGALTENDEQAGITLLGRVAISLPLDLLPCRLVVYGVMFGCICDAVVMAAAMSLRMEPFTLPMIMIMKDVKRFQTSLKRSFEARINCDDGEYSEPIMMRNLMKKWLLEVKNRGYEDTSDVHNADSPQGAAKVSKKGINDLRKQFAQDNAVDAKRLREFENAVADIVSRIARFIEPNSLQDMELTALMQILHTEEEAESTGGIFNGDDPSTLTEENQELLKASSDILKDLYFKHPSLLFEKDSLFLKSLLTASFSPYYVQGTCFDEMKQHGGFAMVSKSERTANAMLSHDVKPKASLALNNILSNDNLFLRGNHQLIEEMVSLTCNPQKIAIDVDRVFLEFGSSSSMPQQLSLVHDIPFAGHLLNQFGDGRNKFQVPLRIGSFAQRVCRRDQITFNRPVQPYIVNWVYKHQKAGEAVCESVMQGSSYSCRNPVGFMCETRGPAIKHYAVVAKISGKTGSDASQGCTLQHMTVLPSENDGIFAKVMMLAFTSQRIKIEFIVTDTIPSITKCAILSGHEINFTDKHPLRAEWLPLINDVRDEISRVFQDQHSGEKIHIPNCLIKYKLENLFKTIKENKGHICNTERLATKRIDPFKGRHDDKKCYILKPFKMELE